MSRKQYVYNPYPNFVPVLNSKKRPSFIQYAMKCASNTDVARNEINYTRQPKNLKTGKKIVRFRRLNEHRARALRAMVQAMLYYFNIASTLVMASVEKLSDQCGLSTISKAGNKSITRASRLITQFMEPMGFVKCEKVWDKILGMYIPKMIFLTPLFFLLCNISKEKFKKIQIQQLRWINQNLLEKGCEKITLIESKRRAKEQHIYYAFQSRQFKHIAKKKKMYAIKILKLKEKKARSYLLNMLVKRYSIQELSEMGASALKKQVNIEYFKLRKLAKL
ncbi:Probable replication-associated protein RepA1 (plasmid) [Buchnera aphidicola (Tuberolachnus salignus)]|nr:plasmid replication initiator RepA [Buchnera aphidicola]CUR53372.1 Probable replication-associated protein RepA1 [Buchnera aphidicola (Tuberolachnus salignus)]